MYYDASITFGIISHLADAEAAEVVFCRSVGIRAFVVLMAADGAPPPPANGIINHERCASTNVSRHWRGIRPAEARSSGVLALS